MGVAVLALRYGLQRGLVCLFSAASSHRVLSSLQAFHTQLSASDVRVIACWWSSSGCKNPGGAVGFQPHDGAVRHMHLVDAAASERDLSSNSARSAVVPIVAGEVDPITRFGTTHWEPMTELRAAPALEVLSPGMASFGDILDNSSGYAVLPCASDSPHCSPRLQVVPPRFLGAHYGTHYKALMANLSAATGAA
eukprot:2397693-Prymnesium_polylepis.1